jgi:Na+-transporting methylmalonyl-CoA/oxaloacetate decarboxylase gamma subunit
MAWIERLSVGLQLTVVGMGLVFLLLGVLWLLLTMLLRLDRAPAAPAATAPARAHPAAPAPAPPVPTPLLTAIGVAVLVHRAVRRKQAAPYMRSHWPGSLLYASRWVAGGRHIQNQAWHPKSR